MKLRWPGRHTGVNQARRPTDSETTRIEPERGPRVRLERIGDPAEAEPILSALAARYEVEQAGDGLHVVCVSDAVYDHEAVVRLASTLDEINPAWPQHLRWPRVQQ